MKDALFSAKMIRRGVRKGKDHRAGQVTSFRIFTPFQLTPFNILNLVSQCFLIFPLLCWMIWVTCVQLLSSIVLQTGRFIEQPKNQGIEY